jgi:hypothetical protein
MMSSLRELKRKLPAIKQGLEEPSNFISRRLLRTHFHNDRDGGPPFPGRLRELDVDRFRFLMNTLTFFESVSLRKPEVVPDKQVDVQDVLQRLTKLERAGFHRLDFDAHQKMKYVMELAVEILHFQRLLSDDRAGFDVECVERAIRLKSDYAGRVVVLFLEQVAGPKDREAEILAGAGCIQLADTDRIQAELLAELGAVSHGRLRSRIRQTLKKMRRTDLFAQMGAGGPPIGEPMPKLVEAETEPAGGKAEGGPGLKEAETKPAAGKMA